MYAQNYFKGEDMNGMRAQVVAFTIKITIVALWIGIICGLLYLPNYIASGLSDKTLNIFTWSGLFDGKILSEFEAKTGVKVNLSYYDSNEELLVKLRATKGVGYDIIIPSDYTVDILRKERLLKELDHTKIEAFKDFNPYLMNHYFDPNNTYSLPYEWSIFGFGIDTDFFKDKKKPATWSAVFAPDLLSFKFVMPNDALLSIPFSAYYLFNSIAELDAHKLASIKQALMVQRPWVLAYIDARADYLLATKNCPLVVSSSSYIARSMLEHDFIDFVIPSEGTILTIESIAALKNSKKDDMIYAFINFIYKPEIVKEHFESHLFFPAITTVYADLEVPERIRKLIELPEHVFRTCDFFKIDSLKNGLGEEDLQYLWLSIKK